MRTAWVCIFILLLPGVALADGLANGAFVFEKAAYQELVKKAGGIEKVQPADLVKTSVRVLFFKDYDSKEFKVGDQRFRVHVAQKEHRVIYSIFRIIEKNRIRHTHPRRQPSTRPRKKPMKFLSAWANSLRALSPRRTGKRTPSLLCSAGATTCPVKHLARTPRSIQVGRNMLRPTTAAASGFALRATPGQARGGLYNRN